MPRYRGSVKIGGTVFGRAKKVKKAGRTFVVRKILSGRNKGKSSIFGIV